MTVKITKIKIKLNFLCECFKKKKKLSAIRSCNSTILIVLLNQTYLLVKYYEFCKKTS